MESNAKSLEGVSFKICVHHPSYKCLLVCMKCLEGVCLKCLTEMSVQKGAHQGHALKEEEDVKEDLEKMIEEQQSRLAKLTSTVEGIEKDIEKYYKKTTVEVRDRAERAHDDIKKWEEEMLQKIDVMHEQARSFYKSTPAKLQSNLEEVKMKFNADVTSERSFIGLMDIIVDLKTQVDELEARRLDRIIFGELTEGCIVELGDLTPLTSTLESLDMSAYLTKGPPIGSQRSPNVSKEGSQRVGNIGQYNTMYLAYDAAIFSRIDKRTLVIYVKNILQGNSFDKVYDGTLPDNTSPDCNIVILKNGTIVFQDDVTSLRKVNMTIFKIFEEKFGQLVGVFSPDQLVYRKESALDIYSAYGNHKKLLSMELKTKSLKSTIRIIEHEVTKWKAIWEAQCRTLYIYDEKGQYHSSLTLPSSNHVICANNDVIITIKQTSPASLTFTNWEGCHLAEVTHTVLGLRREQKLLAVGLLGNRMTLAVRETEPNQYSQDFPVSLYMYVIE